MKHPKLLILLLAAMLVLPSLALTDPPDNGLVKYYSAYLTMNINRAMERAKILYHFSKEPAFDTRSLEKETGKIKQDIDDANDNIANIVLNTFDKDKKNINKYLDNIDKHFAQVNVDLKLIPQKIDKHEEIAPILSDIYYQLKKAEYTDHKEIKRILKLKSLDEPIYIELDR
jgi:Zn-dependent oligopeptidase